MLLLVRITPGACLRPTEEQSERMATQLRNAYVELYVAVLDGPTDCFGLCEDSAFRLACR